MAENKYNLYELQKEIPYETVAPILTAWDEQSDNAVTDLARMAYDAGRNSISKEKNKMEQVAALFGKKKNERFTVRYGTYLFDCKFTDCGFTSYGAYENPYLDCDAFILEDLLVGRAVIVDE